MKIAAPRLAPAIAGLLICALVLFSPAVLNDGDTWWHVRAGQWMIAHHAVIRQDVFSYTFYGKPWLTHEWLSEVLMGGAFDLAGWSGVVGLTAAAAGLCAFVLTRSVGRSLSGVGLALTIVLALMCTAPGMLARPHVLALPCLALWTDGLVAARARGVSPSLLLLPVMAIWANLHGGFVFGLVLIGPFALEAALAAPGPLSQKLSAVRPWLVFSIAAVAACLVTPHGLDGLLFPIRLIGMTSLAGIQEWQASDFSRLGPLEIVLLAVVAALSRGVIVPPLRLVLLLGLLHMALQHERNVMLLGIVGALVLAEPLSQLTSDLPAPERSPRWLPLVVGIIAAALLVARIALPVTRVDGPSAPVTALASVPTALRTQPVFNDYAVGGYLIWTGVKPFIDSRAELYGDAFIAAYAQATQPDARAIDAMIKTYGVRWAILSSGNSVATVLDSRPDWRRTYVDRFAVVYVRN